MSHFQRGFNLSPHIVLEGTVSIMIMPDFTKIRYVRYVKDLLNINRGKDFGLHSLIATTYRYQSRVSYIRFFITIVIKNNPTDTVIVFALYAFSSHGMVTMLEYSKLGLG